MLASIDLAVFFALWAVGWWIVMIAGAITLLTLTEFESYAWTGIVFFGLLAFLQLSSFNILGWITANPVSFVVLIAGYAAVGVVYSMLKWRFSFLRRERERYDELESKFKEVADSDDRVKVGTYRNEEDNDTIDKAAWLSRAGWCWETVKVRYNKARITAWIGYWPWSLLWTLIDDPIRKMAEWLYATFKGWYEALQANAFKGVDVPKN